MSTNSFHNLSDRCNLWTMKLPLPLRVLIICAGIILQVEIAFACSCGRKPPVVDAYEKAHAVLIARVLSIEPYKDDKHPELARIKNLSEYGDATLIVEKVYKGTLRVNEQFSFGSYPNAACIWSFRKEDAGRRFLFYLSSVKGQDGWFASTCSRTRGLENAAEDLLYLDNMEKYRGKTRVSGIYRGSWRVTLEDVANKTIRIIGEKNTYETKTNDDGVFEIYDLPPGDYSLEPEIPKGWQIAHHNSIESTPSKSILFKLEAKKHVTLNVMLEPSNTVEGSVIGPDGNPMEDVCVALFNPDQVERTTAACTDKYGVFSIWSVPEGSYVVALNADGKLSPEEPFPTIFYPNVAQREKATVITVGNGETVKGIDFVVGRIAETVTLSGVLLFSDGKPVADEYVEFVPLKKDDEERSDTTDREGRFSIRIIKGVKGEVFGEFYASPGDYEKCPKLDALIKASGEETAKIKTPVIKVEAEQNVENLVLQFPFPKCKRKE